jgi:hypothetical protein
VNGATKDEQRFRQIALNMKRVADLPEGENTDGLALIARQVDHGARLEECETLMRDLCEAEPPQAARAWLAAARRKLEQRMAQLSEALA